MTAQPFFSVVVPHPPGKDLSALLQAIGRLDYDSDRFEVLLVEGRHPSRQRNLGAREARGRVLCFWDHNSLPTPDYLRVLERLWTGHNPDAVGGPCLFRAADGKNRLFECALSSFCSLYRMSSRYAARGALRETDEQELIGCNLAVGKSVFESLGGFDERFYPGEENDLMRRMKAAGHRLFYAPELVVYKDLAWSPGLFAGKMLRYGCGRMQALLTARGMGDWVYLGPPLLCVYLLSLPLLRPGLPGLAPLVFYGAVAAGWGVSIRGRISGLRWRLAAPGVFFLTHLSYGAGMLAALARRIFGLPPFSTVDDTPCRIRKLDAVTRSLLP